MYSKVKKAITNKEKKLQGAAILLVKNLLDEEKDSTFREQLLIVLYSSLNLNDAEDLQ